MSVEERNYWHALQYMYMGEEVSDPFPELSPTHNGLVHVLPGLLSDSS